MGAGVGKEFNNLAQSFGGQGPGLQGLGPHGLGTNGLGAHAGPAAALLVHEAVMRSRRAPAGRLALVLHLSRLVPPAPRPYHVRIARSLLQDTAARHEGQVFTLANADMILLCAASGSGVGEGMSDTDFPPASRPTLATDPAALPAILLRLLRADMKPTDQLVSLWRLDEAADEVQAYTRARLREAEGLPGREERVPARVLGQSTMGMLADVDIASQTLLADAMAEVAHQAPMPDIVQRQTAILLGAGTPGGEGSSVLRPLFREVGFSIAALQARLAGESHTGQVAADPFLFRHVAGRMDSRMLRELGQDRHPDGSFGLLDELAPASDAEDEVPVPPIKLHINLGVPAILSEMFARLAITCARRGLRIGVEINLMDAMIDPEAFARARRVLVEHRMDLVLDGVSHAAMMLSKPWKVQPDLLKLEWSPRILDLPERDAAMLQAAITQADPARVVLQRAETEAALRWGVARGIRRFQGRHVDAMLGASRLVACAHAGACTLRQCVDRAAGTGAFARAGCRNQSLLRRAAPAPASQAGTGMGTRPSPAGVGA